MIAAGRMRAALGVSARSRWPSTWLGNALLVPRFGAEGAAAVTLATESAVFVLSLTVLARSGAAPRPAC